MVNMGIAASGSPTNGSKGWVAVWFPEPVTIDRISWARDREQKFQDRLATDYRIEVARRFKRMATRWHVPLDRQPYKPGSKGQPAVNVAGLRASKRCSCCTGQEAPGRKGRYRSSSRRCSEIVHCLTLVTFEERPSLDLSTAPWRSDAEAPRIEPGRTRQLFR